MRRYFTLLMLLLLAHVAAAAGQGGTLQIHFMDVGQGDGAVLISPGGEVVLFDDGALKNCDKPVAYLQQLGIKHIDYHIASHYHSDHIGCAQEVFSEFPLTTTAYDRGSSYQSSVYDRYVKAVGNHRKQATDSTEIILDKSASNPVRIDIVALNGNGIQTTNENDLSVVSVVHYGPFTVSFGGDLSGYLTSSYQDIETSVAPKVGAIQVYKVHHHCSAYSTNDTWLAITKPQIGIVSVGDGNDYHHPTQDCLERLHKANVKTYWTETGNGAEPEPAWDSVVGTVVVEVAAGGASYTVHTQRGTETYTVAGGSGPSITPPGSTPTATPKYVWSKKSDKYHYANCRYAQSISAENRMTGDTPPTGMTLHKNCPR